MFLSSPPPPTLRYQIGMIPGGGKEDVRHWHGPLLCFSVSLPGICKTLYLFILFLHIFLQNRASLPTILPPEGLVCAETRICVDIGKTA